MSYDKIKVDHFSDLFNEWFFIIAVNDDMKQS